MSARAYLVQKGCADDEDVIYEIDQKEFVIGRSDPDTGEEGVSLQVMSGTVSARHCLIKISRDAFQHHCTIRDLSRRNGTHVNGRRLLDGEEHPLHDGDRISLGKKARSPVYTFQLLATADDFRKHALEHHRRKRRRVDDQANSLAERLWSDRKFSDATIVCQGEHFSVHRAILAAASPVFEAMFSQGMREAASSSAELRDTSSAAVRAMLEYIYLETPPAACVAAEALHLARQYELHGLAEDCAASMLDNMTKENALDVVRAIRPFKDREALQPLWQGIRSAFKVMLQDDSLLDQCVALL